MNFGSLFSKKFGPKYMETTVELLVVSVMKLSEISQEHPPTYIHIKS